MKNSSSPDQPDFEYIPTEITPLQLTTSFFHQGRDFQASSTLGGSLTTSFTILNNLLKELFIKYNSILI
jgi:hypothetical protein